MRINVNIVAINASRNPMASNEQLHKSLARVASGDRAGRPADDTDGLALSEGLQARLRGNAQAQRDAQAGISYLQTTEGALTDVHNLLLHLRDLAAEAATGTPGARSRAGVDKLLAGIRAIGTTTTFSGVPVFADRTNAAPPVPAGATTVDVLAAVGRNLTLDPSTTGVLSAPLAVDLGSATNAANAVVAIDRAIGDVIQVRSDLGLAQNRLEHTVATLGVAAENLTASQDHIRNVEKATEIVELTRGQIVAQDRTARLAQANPAPPSMLLLLQG